MRDERKALKSARIKADKMLQRWLSEAGGIVTFNFTASKANKWPIDCPEYTLETALGKLLVCPASSHGRCYTCFARFDEPKRAAAVVGSANMNDYSGKWNFLHFGNKTTPTEFVAWVTSQICEHCRNDLSPIVPTPGSDYVYVGRDLVKGGGQ